MALNTIVLGAPGAGKGTQAVRLAKDYGVPKISTGDILREAVQEGTALGRAAKATMDAGKLVSDEVMIGIVRERLARPDAAPGFVLDGFPRTIDQARALDTLMAGRDPLVVLEIRVPEDALVQRLLARRVCEACGHNADAASAAACGRCGGRLVQRSDDNEATIRQRLAVYRRDTQPLVDYYQSRPTFRSVDGDRPPDEVTARLKEALEAAARHGVGPGDRAS